MKLVLALLALSLLWACKVGVPQPTGLSLTPGSNSMARLNIKLKNPNFFGLRVKQLKVAVHVNGKEIAQIQGDKVIKIRRNSEETYPIDLSLNPQQLLANGPALLQMLSGKPPDIRIVGGGKVRYFLFFEKKFTANQGITP
jgi:hypothetical protein